MAENFDLEWRLSGGASNVDPDAALGGAMSTVAGGLLHDTQSSVTAGASIGDTEVFDSGLGGNDGDHDGKYLLFLTGFPNVTNQQELFPIRIRSYRASDGRFALERPLIGSVANASLYRLFPVRNLFDDCTAAECAAGDVEYRGLFQNNTSGQNLTDHRILMRIIDPSDTRWAIAADDNTGGTPSLPTIPDEDTDPDIASMDPDASFTRPITFTQAQFDQPKSLAPSGAIGLGSASARGVFVRRTLQPNSRRRNGVHVVIIGQATSPSPVQTVRCGAVIAFDFEGFTPQIALTRDRSVRIGGGARFCAEVRAQETGLVVPNLEVGWVLTGLGQLMSPDDLTDEDGLAKATYVAPTDQGQAGNTFTVEVRV